MRAVPVEHVNEAHHTARRRLPDGQLVAPRNLIQRLRHRRGLRGIGKRDVNIVRGQLAGRASCRRLQLRANGDFRFPLRHLLRRSNHFSGHRAQLGFRDSLFSAAYQAQENGRGEQPQQRSANRKRGEKFSAEEKIPMRCRPLPLRLSKPARIPHERLRGLSHRAAALQNLDGLLDHRIVRRNHLPGRRILVLLVQRRGILCRRAPRFDRG